MQLQDTCAFAYRELPWRMVGIPIIPMYNRKNIYTTTPADAERPLGYIWGLVMQTRVPQHISYAHSIRFIACSFVAGDQTGSKLFSLVRICALPTLRKLCFLFIMCDCVELQSVHYTLPPSKCNWIRICFLLFDNSPINSIMIGYIVCIVIIVDIGRVGDMLFNCMHRLSMIKVNICN